MVAVSGHITPRMGTDEWLTPPSLIQALGAFDLDPCAPPLSRRLWATARDHYSLPDQDGLILPWHGRVWLNPPYGRVLAQWLERMAEHGDGTALIFARTETAAFQHWVWPMASAVLFLEGRLNFHRAVTGEVTNDGGAPSMLIAYDRFGERNMHALRDAGLAGAWIECRRALVMVPAPAWETWRERVLGHLRRLGRATLTEIYLAVAADPSVPATNRHVNAKVRQTLYRFAKRDGDCWMAAA